MEIGPRTRPDFFMPSTIGLFFSGLGAFFYALRYICAAIMYAGESSRKPVSFYERYAEVGPDLTYVALLFFVIGAGFLLLNFKLAQQWKDEFMVKMSRD